MPRGATAGATPTVSINRDTVAQRLPVKLHPCDSVLRSAVPGLAPCPTPATAARNVNGQQLSSILQPPAIAVAIQPCVLGHLTTKHDDTIASLWIAERPWQRVVTWDSNLEML